MLSIILDQFIKKGNNNKTRDIVVRTSFFVFQGLLASILINDLLRVLYGTFEHKSLLEYGLAGVIALSPYVINKFTLMHDKKNNMSMSIGMIIGTWLANSTEYGVKLL
jgi:hypothetical protein